MNRLLCSLLLFPIVAFVSGCGENTSTDTTNAPTISVSGGRSALVTIDRVTLGAGNDQSGSRASALLGVFVAEYLSITPAVAANSAVSGVLSQSIINTAQSTVTDPDLKLLESFAEALSVDVAALLNRSVNRQESLDAYTEALNNIATRVNDRYRELRASEDLLAQSLRTIKKELTSAERELKKAKDDKDYRLASEKQKIILDKQKESAETELQLVQVSDMVDQIGEYLELYGEKILAIERNREALIAGIKVTDVPGVEELQLIERGDRKSNAPKQRNGLMNPFDSLF